MYLPPAIVAGIDDLGLHKILLENQFYTVMSVVAFWESAKFGLVRNGLASSVDWLPYRHVDGTVITGGNFPRVALAGRDCPIMALSQSKGTAARLFKSVDGSIMPFAIDDHPP